MTEPLLNTTGVTREVILREIHAHLEPYSSDTKLSGNTVIAKDLTIDSLAIMDMVMELENRFDVSIPMSAVAEINTIDELADEILALHEKQGA